MRAKLKRCKKCNELKLLDAEHYHRNRLMKTGFSQRCKECVNASYKKRPLAEYAIYDDEEIVAMGTAEELSEKLKIKIETIRHYTSASHYKENKGKGRLAIRIDC